MTSQTATPATDHPETGSGYTAHVRWWRDRFLLP